MAAEMHKVQVSTFNTTKSSDDKLVQKRYTTRRGPRVELVSLPAFLLEDSFPY
jgi:hypothetical protein